MCIEKDTAPHLGVLLQLSSLGRGSDSEPSSETCRAGSPGAGHSLLSTGHPSPQHPRDRMEGKAFTLPTCLQQWKVHLVHPLSAPDAASWALGSSLSPQVCWEHGSEGLVVTHYLHEGEPTHRHHHTPQAGAVSAPRQTSSHT